MKKTYNFISKAQTVTNKYNLLDSINKSRQQILNTYEVWLLGSGWAIESVDGHYINIVAFKPLRGSGYIEQPFRTFKFSQRFNRCNECFRHLNSQTKDSNRTKKSDTVIS